MRIRSSHLSLPTNRILCHSLPVRGGPAPLSVGEKGGRKRFRAAWLDLRAWSFLRPSPFPLFIQECEHQIAFGHDGVVYHATAARFRQPTLPGFKQLRMNEKCVAWENWFPKFYFICAHEITDPARSLRQSQ